MLESHYAYKSYVKTSGEYRFQPVIYIPKEGLYRKQGFYTGRYFDIEIDSQGQSVLLNHEAAHIKARKLFYDNGWGWYEKSIKAITTSYADSEEKARKRCIGSIDQ